MAGVGEDFYSPKQVTALLGISRTTLGVYMSRWKKQRNGPPLLRLGHRTIKFPKTAFRRWAGLEG